MRPRAHLHIQREGYYKVSQLPVSQSTRFSITPLISHAHCGTYTGWQHVSYSVPQSRRIFPFNICTISYICTTQFSCGRTQQISSFPFLLKFLSFYPFFRTFSTAFWLWEIYMRCSIYGGEEFEIIWRRKLCANKCKIIKMTAELCNVCGCCFLINGKYITYTPHRTATSSWVNASQFKPQLPLKYRVSSRPRSAFNYAWKCWRQDNNGRRIRSLGKEGWDGEGPPFPLSPTKRVELKLFKLPQNCVNFLVSHLIIFSGGGKDFNEVLASVPFVRLGLTLAWFGFRTGVLRFTALRVESWRRRGV